MAADCTQCHSPLPELPPALRHQGGTVMCRQCGHENADPLTGGGPGASPPADQTAEFETKTGLLASPFAEEPTLTKATEAPRAMPQKIPGLPPSEPTPWSKEPASAGDEEGFIGGRTSMISPANLKNLREAMPIAGLPSVPAPPPPAPAAQPSEFWAINPTGLFNLGDVSSAASAASPKDAGAAPLAAALRPSVSPAPAPVVPPAALLTPASPESAALPQPRVPSLPGAKPTFPGLPQLSGKSTGPYKTYVLGLSCLLALSLLGLWLRRPAVPTAPPIPASALEVHRDQREGFARIRAVQVSETRLAGSHRALMLQGELETKVECNGANAPTAAVEMRDLEGAMVAQSSAPVGFLPSGAELSKISRPDEFVKLGLAWRAAQPAEARSASRFLLLLVDPPEPLGHLSAHVHLGPPPGAAVGGPAAPPTLRRPAAPLRPPAPVGRRRGRQRPHRPQ
jgi:hypothetical protein